MKRLVTIAFIVLFSVRAAMATTYYVDGGPAGNDSNPGTSISYPWKSIQKAASTVRAGDTVYIRGAHDGFPGYYYVGNGGHLSPTNNGSGGNPIAWETYPPDHTRGFDAILTCGKEYTDGWTRYSGNVYRTIEGVQAEGGYGKYAWIWNDNGTWKMFTYHEGVTTRDNMRVGEGFRHSDGHFYINVGRDPSSVITRWNAHVQNDDFNIYLKGKAHHIFRNFILEQASNYSVRILDSHELIFDGIHIRFVGRAGGLSAETNGGSVYNIDFKSGIIEWVGTRWASESDEPASCGLGINLGGPTGYAYNWTITDSKIHHCTKDAIHIGSGGYPNNAYNIYIYDNTIYHCGEDGIDFKANSYRGWSHIYDNLIYDHDEVGVSATGRGDYVKVYNNFIYNTGNTDSAAWYPYEDESFYGVKMEWNGGNNWEIYNNIIYGWYKHGIGCGNRSPKIFNNTLYGNGKKSRCAEIEVDEGNPNIKNNILLHVYGSYALKIEYGTTPSSVENNIIYSVSSDPVYLDGSGRQVPYLNDKPWASGNLGENPELASPGSTDPVDYKFMPGSPAEETGLNLVERAGVSWSNDFFKIDRGAEPGELWSIGASETAYTDDPDPDPPAPPTGLKIQ